MGDFWGIEKNFARVDDDQGISLVMVHTEKGRNIRKEIQSGAEFFPVTKEQCTQPNLVAPSKENPNREYFWRWCRRYGFRRKGQRMGYLPASKGDELLLFLYRVENKLLVQLCLMSQLVLVNRNRKSRLLVQEPHDEETVIWWG